jgi:hypothetical protein
VNIRQQTIHANSHSGVHTKYICPIDLLTGKAAVQCNDADKITVQVDSGTPIRKFVDPLPPLASPGGPAGNSSGKYIPNAVPTKWRNVNGDLTNDEYYEIASVEW